LPRQFSKERALEHSTKLTYHVTDKERFYYDTLAYFDSLHLAPYIQCPTLVDVGMKDATCPAHTILPVFERITTPKALHVYPELTHAPCTDFNADVIHWLRRYLGT